VLRGLKRVAERVIRFSLAVPRLILLVTVILVAVAMAALWKLERDFLPPFNEGSAQLNVVLAPGTSLEMSQDIARQVDARLKEMPFITAFGRRTGRAELDEHAMPVNISEYILSFNPRTELSREEILKRIRAAMDEIPGIVTSVEQPLAHLISHMLSGVKAQIGIKLYGEDLDVLRSRADEMQAVIADVPGVTDLVVEPQQNIPQLRIELDRDKLLMYGLTPAQVNDYIATARCSSGCGPSTSWCGSMRSTAKTSVR
jgi:HME family heavy-metal exporter